MRRSSAPKLFVVAGKSGGHIVPALQVAQRWREHKTNSRVLLFTSSSKIDEMIAQHYPFLKGVVRLPIENLPGRRLWRYPAFLMQVFYATLKSSFYLIFARPEKVVTTGGYIAVPVVMVAWLLRIPVIMYEVNVLPGKAILWLARFATAIHIPFPVTRKYFKPQHASKCVVDSYPLRFTALDKNADKAEIIKKINEYIPGAAKFDDTRKTIFIIGGSQGSEFINNLVISWLKKRHDLWPRLQVIHQIGVKDLADHAGWYSSQGIPAYTFTYNHEVKDLYHLADVVVSRAGAGTLFELEFFEKPSIIIPLKTVAQNHQVANAEEMALRNPSLFVVLDQDEIKKEMNSFDEAVSRFLL